MATKRPININGSEYDWSDIEISMLGSTAPIDGCRAIEYTEKTDHENVRGRGGKPIATAMGSTDFEGSITLLQSELDAILDALPADSRYPTRLPPFTISVAYIGKDDVVITDKLVACRIKEVKKSSKVDDKYMEVVCPLVIGDIKYHS